VVVKKRVQASRPSGCRGTGVRGSTEQPVLFQASKLALAQLRVYDSRKSGAASMHCPVCVCVCVCELWGAWHTARGERANAGGCDLVVGPTVLRLLWAACGGGAAFDLAAAVLVHGEAVGALVFLAMHHGGGGGGGNERHRKQPQPQNRNAHHPQGREREMWERERERERERWVSERERERERERTKKKPKTKKPKTKKPKPSIFRACYESFLFIPRM
jgi:hypothetical protein